jgi:hypothetical protein
MWIIEPTNVTIRTITAESGSSRNETSALNALAPTPAPIQV